MLGSFPTHMCYLRTHAAVHVSFPNGKVCNNVHVHVVISIMNYFVLFHLNRTTMYTEYSILEQIHKDVEDRPLKAVFTYNHFRLSWYAYLSMLDIDLSLGFSCKACGRTPDVLIMDATSLSFRRALDSWSAIFSTDNEMPKKKGR